MNKMRKLILGLLTLVVIGIAGCNSMPTKPSSQISMQDFVKTIDPKLLQRCPALPVPASTVTPTSDLLPMYSSLQGQYSDCAIRHDCLIAVITGETICFQPGKENEQSGHNNNKN